MKQEIDKKIMFVIMIVAIILLPAYKIITNNNTKIDKRINEIKREQFAMYIEEEKGYKEYTESDIFPEGYVLNIAKSKCEDSNGSKVETEKVLSSNGNSITVKSNKTIYCTMYFDYVGDGSKERPYKIQYIEDLVEIEEKVNKGETTYENTYFEMWQDLDFNDEKNYKDYKTTKYGDINGNSQDEELKTELTTGRGWKPIGKDASNPFQGILDGKNHRIDHLYIKNDIDASNIGLFGRIVNSEVKNLTIGGEITTSVNANVGAFVSILINSKLNNCHNEANITSEVGRYGVGGVVGILSGGEVSECVNDGTITGGNNTGGVIGAMNGNNGYQDITIKKCINNGEIVNSLGLSAMGGIVGRTDTSVPVNLSITECTNNGLVTTGKSTATEQKIGGIIGITSGGSQTLIENCNNYGEVISEYNESNTSFVGNGGGIVGRVAGDSKGTVTEIVNSNNHAEINGMKRGGGIVGHINTGGTLRINNSSNDKNVTGNATNNDYSGGIIGYADSSVLEVTLTKTHNTGEISGSQHSGGLIANMSGKSTNINNSSNEGNVSASSTNSTYSGGLIGWKIGSTNTSTIVESYNTGTVTGNNNTGGFVGYNEGTITIRKSYNTGKITGKNRTGGLIGLSFDPYTITESYNTGTVTGSGEVTGGLVGQGDGTITKSYNTGKITGYGHYTGGLIGASFGPYTITGSYNTGTITGYGICTGGLIGNLSHGSYLASILNSHNGGDVLSDSGDYASGIGNVSAGSLIVINSYNSGAVSGGTKANAGITTAFQLNYNYVPSSRIYNAYNRGTITGTNANGIEYHDSASTYTGNYTYNMPSAGQASVDTLNSNINKIDLSSIDSSLSGYTLCRWKLGSDNYPTLDC